MILFIVNGEEVPARVGATTLREAVDGALVDSFNTGRPAEDWELRYDNGSLVGDLSHPIDSYRFRPHVCLYLTLRLGVGGNRKIPSLIRTFFLPPAA